MDCVRSYYISLITFTLPLISTIADKFINFLKQQKSTGPQRFDALINYYKKTSLLAKLAKHSFKYESLCSG